MIADIGFSVISSDGIDPLLDIVLIHGLGGHPEKTWRSSYKFWPRDRLAISFPKSRVLVYGYDSKVTKFGTGAASQNSFLDHTRHLLLDLRGIRNENPTRPLLFICHSLGGILVKDLLRRCGPGREDHESESRENIFKSTIGIIFLGTPHQGGGYGSLGRAAERVARYVGFDTNNSILRDLTGNGTSLQIIQEEFLMILKKRSPALPIYSFQEEEGLDLSWGLKGKVVDDSSSKLGYDYETVATLPGNHKQIARIEEAYNRLKDAVGSYVESIKSSARVNLIKQLPYERDSCFLGRQKELEEIHGFCSTDEFFECAIVGLGGVGKTQVAAELAYQLWEKEASKPLTHRHYILWLHASNTPRLEQSLKDLACKLRLIEGDLLPATRDWLNGVGSGKWLIIIDNADDEDVFFGDNYVSKDRKTRQRFCDFLPKKEGCGILYTSRNETCARNLTKRSGPPKLVKVHPKAYLMLWDGRKEDQQDLLKENFVDWRRGLDLPNAVFFSWALSFEQLKKRDEDAVRLLSLMSILDRQSIPGWLLDFYPPLSQSQPRRAKSLSLLRSFSFIHPHQDTSSQDKKWQMHRLVQIATHTYIGPGGMEQALRDGLRMLAEAFISYIFAINGMLLRYERSLEYYPHAKSVIYMLRSLGSPFHRGKSTCEPATIVKQTLEEFARMFEGNRGGDIFEGSRIHTEIAFQMISQGDSNSLEDIFMFIRRAGYMSAKLFAYSGKRPLVSDSVYGELKPRAGEPEVVGFQDFEKSLICDSSKWSFNGEEFRRTLGQSTKTSGDRITIETLGDMYISEQDYNWYPGASNAI
ncbi:uncharacterized protein F4812DRAFT_439075 [Daldinia caldariorum]|uniref:uncharacterized protein n=1 Tax=Daldinia caldariorum TaxID=326644 RepID=UPI0020079DC6|nr:uncharacterized protein F4812DRAFT_439075 [Daldinia caldariorum]KAI1465515.1 hypothetical protein F4812DRAFT_439075 [Daldinia caldariorum]